MISPVDTVKSEGSRIGDLKRWLGTAEEEILIISPYLIPETLNEALSKARDGVLITIVCSWRSKELLFGSAKLETYEVFLLAVTGNQTTWFPKSDADSQRKRQVLNT